MRWPTLLDTAANDSFATLTTVADADWTRRADGLDWSCRTTLDHLVEGLLCYTAQLGTGAADSWTALLGGLRPDAPIRDCLAGVRAAAALLSAAVRHADPADRGWHPWGVADAAGFAAMGVVELTAHTGDLARALGVGWRPDPGVCAAAVDRLFPEAPEGDPVAVLWWCTGRGELPGHPRRRSWQWRGGVPARSRSGN
ncbi:hypothetical protein M8C13_06035 [Crossiella sp. SN42]|uniref:DinB family protein n=1 Tax=Crossiella sp. SN42 TaxID=2944808 RepID=UPI00207C1A44|nr:maleylpyruvate isomerase N-terminal domain-containing protein [Crossiella sp. SN42]MCO1575318.1 hypothetical protein [Crossiella sp. SN42]